MTIKAPQSYREDITELCKKVTEHYNTYCHAATLLGGLNVVIPSYNDTLAKAMNHSINAYVAGVCKKLSKDSQGDTTRTFTLYDLKFNGVHLPSSLDRYQSNHDTPHTQDFILTEILNNFDFDKFVSELNRHTSTLEALGKADIAEHLSSTFSLKASYRDDIIKRTPRHFSFSSRHQSGWYGKYEYEMADKINRLKFNVAIVAKEFESPQLLAPFNELADAIVSGSSVLSSGTSFGNTNTVSIKVFKEHIRYSLTPAMMDLVVTYIRMYAPNIELCELPQAA